MLQRFFDLEAEASWLMQLRVENLAQAVQRHGGSIVGIREFCASGAPKVRVYYELPRSAFAAKPSLEGLTTS